MQEDSFQSIQFDLVRKRNTKKLEENGGKQKYHARAQGKISHQLGLKDHTFLMITGEFPIGSTLVTGPFSSG